MFLERDLVRRVPICVGSRGVYVWLASVAVAGLGGNSRGCHAISRAIWKGGTRHLQIHSELFDDAASQSSAAHSTHRWVLRGPSAARAPCLAMSKLSRTQGRAIQDRGKKPTTVLVACIVW
jgi:hypothetical protein